MKNDISKLPAWAQSEIKRLQADNKRYQEKIDEMMGVSDAETNTYIWGGMEHKPLPNDTRIQFELPDGGRFVIGVSGDGLDVNYSKVRGEKRTRLAALPQAANALYLTGIED